MFCCDYQIAAAICQFNEGVSYLETVCKKLEHHTNKTTLSRFVVKRNLAESRQSKYSKTKEFKVQRKLPRKNRIQTQDKRELLEGTCYQSGIDTGSTHASLIQSILEDREYKEQSDVYNWIRNCSKCLSITTEFLPTKDSICFYYDIETGCLSNIQTFYRLFLRKLHLQMKVSSEKRHLLTSMGILNAVSPQVAAQKIVDFLNQDCRMNGRRTLLIVHNGRNSDEERFINFLKRNKAFDNIEEKQNLYFGDSIPACRKVLKNKIK